MDEDENRDASDQEDNNRKVQGEPMDEENIVQDEAIKCDRRVRPREEDSSEEEKYSPSKRRRHRRKIPQDTKKDSSSSSPEATARSTFKYPMTPSPGKRRKKRIRISPLSSPGIFESSTSAASSCTSGFNSSFDQSPSKRTPKSQVKSRYFSKRLKETANMDQGPDISIRYPITPSPSTSYHSGNFEIGVSPTENSPSRHGYQPLQTENFQQDRPDDNSTRLEHQRIESAPLEFAEISYATHEPQPHIQHTRAGTSQVKPEQTVRPKVKLHCGSDQSCTQDPYHLDFGYVPDNNSPEIESEISNDELLMFLPFENLSLKGCESDPSQSNYPSPSSRRRKVQMKGVFKLFDHSQMHPNEGPKFYTKGSVTVDQASLSEPMPSTSWRDTRERATGVLNSDSDSDSVDFTKSEHTKKH